MIRTKGEPGTGDVVQAVRHMRLIQKEIRTLVSMRDDELFESAKQLQVAYELVRYVHDMVSYLWLILLQEVSPHLQTHR